MLFRQVQRNTTLRPDSVVLRVISLTATLLHSCVLFRHALRITTAPCYFDGGEAKRDEKSLPSPKTQEAVGVKSVPCSTLSRAAVS